MGMEFLQLVHTCDPQVLRSRRETICWRWIFSALFPCFSNIQQLVLLQFYITRNLNVICSKDFSWQTLPEKKERRLAAMRSVWGKARVSRGLRE